ncbi:hypothetical protein Fmac_030834 [Flemingia macrophylla]|uniref:SHSP domain-containing protein n=1 Tax=Flemingia macrophylla TaxID=520843 RepID=A0ABD1L0T7_9FABA
MDSTTKPSADRVYEDFEPYYEWNRDERVVNVLLPGFRRDQLKVQVTSKPTLRLMGERQITENRWRRFNLELPLLSDYDTDQVTARFVGAKLSINFGKLTRPNETISAPQNAEEKKATQEDGPKEEAKTNGEVSGPKAPQQEEIKNETTESKDKKAEEAKTNNGSRETKETEASKAPRTGLVSRTKTRLIGLTQSFGPNQVDNEDSDVRMKKWNKMLKWAMLVLLVVALVGYVRLYVRNAFTSSPEPEEPYFLEL